MLTDMPPMTDTLRDRISGQVLVPGDPEYDTARRVWNADIDRSPAIIAKVSGPADVAVCLDFARRQGIDFSVRGGGHSLGGAALCDDLVIDLSTLRTVTVDPVGRTARAGGGATNADLDLACQEYGLAVPTGTVSDTGIGGLTLGGGFGWLTRKHGLAIDNLVSAVVVLADGRIVRASATEYPDLFWALRGGGGNFGVVTEFEYRLHPVGPLVNLGMFFWDVEQGVEALRYVRDLVPTLPSDVGVMVVGMSVPPLPFVPEEHHFKTGYGLMIAGFGSIDEHAQVAARVRAGRAPLFEFVSPLPYTELQKILDEANPPGVFAYEKSVNADDLSDDLIDVLVKTLAEKASPMSATPIAYIGGAYAEVADDATAFGGARRPHYAVGLTAICPTPELLVPDRAWVRSTWERLVPFASNAGGYVNFMADYEEDRVRVAYGPAKYERLARIKAVYDPENVFHHNGNIKPAG